MTTEHMHGHEEGAAPAKQTDVVRADPERFMRRVFGRHLPTLRKLMQLRRCRTGKQVDDLAIDGRALQALLDGEDARNPDGSTLRLRVRDCDLAGAIGLTWRKWANWKRRLLKPPPPSQRENRM